MTKTHLRLLFTLFTIAMVQCLSAQVIAFNMDAEQQQQNTPTGWNAVQLPKNLPTLTEENTFYITNYGATTSSDDNTSAIQSALNAAASAGGGMVVIPEGTWMFERIQIGAKTILHLKAGAMLKLIPYSQQSHTSKTPYITNKQNACDIVIEGEGNTSIIEGQGGPWWDAVENKESGLQRGSIIRFENGSSSSRYLFRNFRIQNAPGTNLTLGNSGRGTHNTVHNVSIYAPSSHAADPSHNTDGIPIWAAYANIYDCDIDTGDDNVVTDSNAQFIHVWNCNFKAGHGASLGSYTENMHDIIFEDLTFEGTDCGFRLKSNIGRSGDVYNLVFRNCTMTGVMNPVQITAWYDTLPNSPEAAAASPETVTSQTPKFRDILIQNVTAINPPAYTSNAKNGYCVMIYGRPESLVKDVTFDNVQIANNKGLKMNFCQGIKFNNCSMTNEKTGKSSTETSVAALLEESYQCDYTWVNGKEAPVMLSDATKASAEGTTYTFANGYSITNDNDKGYGSGKNNTVKYSHSTIYTIHIPEGKSVQAVSFTGYSNHDNNDCYLVNVNGTELNAEDYSYGNRTVLNSADKYVTHTITFDQPVSGVITFQVGNAQACFIIRMTHTSTTGISPIPILLTKDEKNWYSLNGQRLNTAPTQKGVYIINGKKYVIK